MRPSKGLLYSEAEYQTRTCPVCGKRFEIHCHPLDWGFGRGDQLTCSYSCMREQEVQEAFAPKSNRARIAWEMWIAGKKFSEICKVTGHANVRTARTAAETFELHHGDYCRRYRQRKGASA